MDSRTVLAEKARRLSDEQIDRVTRRVQAHPLICAPSFEEAMRQEWQIWHEELDIEIASQKEPN